MKRFVRNPMAAAGSIVLLLLVAAAVFAPWLAPQDPTAIDPLHLLKAPGPGHWLGTDDIGRDVLSRLIYAGRVSIGIGLGVAVLAVTLGAFLGAFAGYYRGITDTAVSGFVDILLTIPMLGLAMVVGAFVNLTPARLVLLLALLAWTGPARIVRGQVLSLSEWPFVEAARAAGSRDITILLRHVLPNAIAPLTVAGTLLVAEVILVESALSFLGFGVAPPTASWGNMLQGAQIYFTQAPWLAIFPGVAISLTVAAINFVGDGMRAAMNVKR